MKQGSSHRCIHDLDPNLCSICRGRPYAGVQPSQLRPATPMAPVDSGTPSVSDPKADPTDRGGNGHDAPLASHDGSRPNPGCTPIFNPGDRVRLKSDPARQGIVVGEPVWQAGSYQYQICFSIYEILTYSEEKLQWVPVSNLRTMLSHKEFLRDLLLLKLRQPLTDSLYSFQASRTLFRVYQFKPVLKFLNSPEQRILIADKVGLGKTIEAGIIYLELKARMDLERVLVICPSGLRAKWHSEMRSRFDEEFTLLDAANFRAFLDDYRRHGGNVRLRGICSLEMLRRDEFADALEELQVGFDLIIIDEAHHLRNAATRSYALGAVLAEQSGALVLLTATPLHLGNQDLFHLMQLINPGEFNSLDEFEARVLPNKYVNTAAGLLSKGQFRLALDELRKLERIPQAVGQVKHPYYREAVQMLSSGKALAMPQVVSLQRRLLELNSLARVFNRTRKREVSDAAERKAITIEVQFSEPERAFYDAVVEFVRWQLSRYGRRSNIPIFSVITRERQAASCIQALRAQFTEELHTRLVNYQTEESRTDLDEDDAGPQRTGEQELEQIRRLLRLCHAVGESDTKFDRFLEAIKALQKDDPSCKILVFSFFRGTLSYLHHRLSQLGFKVGIIHGGMSMEERMRTILEFRDEPSIPIMLSSEVGAEGLDFQFCGAMFDYDLPWNPMRVEQRIGRLDRFGQEHAKILIYNLVIADSIETRIFMRLYDRIRVFEESVGDLEVILGSVISELTADVFMGRLTETEEARKAEEAAKRVERYRQEQDDFEKQRVVFLGQDGLFEQEAADAVESGRYVSADEVRSLVELYVETVFPEFPLETNDGDPTFVLTPTQELIRELSTYASRNRRDSQRTRQFVQKLHDNRLIPITFDADTARQRKLVEFVTVHHPLARIAAEHFMSGGRVPAPPRSSLWTAGSSEFAGDYAFYIYRLAVRCLTPQSTLVPVLVSLRTGAVVPTTPAHCLAEIQYRRELEPPDIACEADRFQILDSSAGERIAEIVREREAEVQEQNDAMVDARIASLEQSYNFRVQALQRQMDAVADASIKRMRRSQINGLLGKLNAKKEAMETRRDVSVGYELVASGLVRFSADLKPVRSRPATTVGAVTETPRQKARTIEPVEAEVPKAAPRAPLPPSPLVPKTVDQTPSRQNRAATGETPRVAPPPGVPSSRPHQPQPQAKPPEKKKSLLGRLFSWLK